MPSCSDQAAVAVCAKITILASRPSRLQLKWETVLCSFVPRRCCSLPLHHRPRSKISRDRRIHGRILARWFAVFISIQLSESLAHASGLDDRLPQKCLPFLSLSMSLSVRPAHEAMKLGAAESPSRASFAGARARSPLEDSANVINSYKATVAPGVFLITARDPNGHIHEVPQEAARAASPRRVASVMRIADSRLRRKNAKKNQMAKFVLHTDPRGQSTAEQGAPGQSEKQWGSEYQIIEGDSGSAAGSPSFGAVEFSPTHTGRAVLQLRSRT